MHGVLTAGLSGKSWRDIFRCLAGSKDDGLIFARGNCMDGLLAGLERPSRSSLGSLLPRQPGVSLRVIAREDWNIVATMVAPVVVDLGEL